MSETYEEFLVKHAPSTKKQIYVADTSSGGVQNELWHIAMSYLIEVKRLREQNELMVEYFRYMRDGGLTDADWITVNEWIGDDEE